MTAKTEKDSSKDEIKVETSNRDKHTAEAIQGDTITQAEHKKMVIRGNIIASGALGQGTPSEIDRLANFILENVPGEPSKDEGAVDCAIRLILDGIAAKQNRLLTASDALDITADTIEAARNAMIRTYQHAQYSPHVSDDDIRALLTGAMSRLFGNIKAGTITASSMASGSDARVIVEENERLVLHSIEAELEERRARGTGRTREQIRSADRNAIFIWSTNSTDYPRKLAESIGRHDVSFYTLDVLNDSKFEGFIAGVSHNAHVILDHAIQMTKMMAVNVDRIEALLGHPLSRYVAPRQDEPTPPVPVKPEIAMTADVIPWSLTGTGLVLRSPTGSHLGHLKLVNPGGRHTDIELRDRSMAIIEQCARRISAVNYHTANVLPQHAEQRPNVKMPEMGSALAGPAPVVGKPPA